MTVRIEGRSADENRRLTHTLHMLPLAFLTEVRCFDAGKAMVIEPVDNSSALEYTLCSQDNPDFADNFTDGTWVTLYPLESTHVRAWYKIDEEDRRAYQIPYESVQLQWHAGKQR